MQTRLFSGATKGRRRSSRGRVAIAFAAIGYKPVAFDSALPMLSELRRKAPDSRIHAVAGEGTRALFARAPVANLSSGRAVRSRDR